VNRVVVVASHRRSGTHLVLDSLRANAKDVNPAFMTLERIEPTHPRHLPVAEFDRRLRGRTGTVLVKTHALPWASAWQAPEAGEYAAQLLAESPTIYVHRDGRDVLVSLYHFIQSYSPGVATQSFSEFIRSARTGRDALGISQAAYWQHHVLAWLDTGPTATASYEALQIAFDASLRTVAERLALELRPSLSPVGLEPRRGRLAGALGAVRRRLGLGPGRSTAIRPRSGGSGGWRETFDEADLAWFETQASEAMRRLGYA
jgi:hypothetical protein